MLGATPVTAQNMSDSQVLEYVKEGIRQGKEQKQLASELARKGVTKEQALRVKQLYEQQNNVNASNATGTDINESRLREEMKENTS
ncbi:MAG: capsule biosynthesis protein, partial [Bacteroides sp.]|nr:capsule biosynthesis protein [Bacteroides sp.]